MRASQAVVGDTIFIVSAAATADLIVQATTIKKIEKVSKKGVYNIHILGGNIVVNNIVASHYIASENLGWFNHVVTAWSPIQHYLFPSSENHDAAVSKVVAAGLTQ